jgi:hypothetical protein
MQTINVIQHINRSKDRNDMILSRHTKKAFEKIQHPFMINAMKKLRMEGKFPIIINAIYGKPRANVKLNGEQLKPFLIK